MLAIQRKRIVGSLITLWVATSCTALTKAEQSPKLNFVIINIDDMGCKDLGCYGSTFYETPELDRFATKALKFNQAYAACAVCSPSRASLMTGQYPTRHGITNFISHLRCMKKIKAGKPIVKKKGEFKPGNKKRLTCPAEVEELPLECQTIAELLKPAGYVTANIGKWHLGQSIDHFPEAQGFDLNIGGCSLGQPGSYFDPYSRKDWPTPHNLIPRKKGEYLTDRLTDESIKFISDNKETPFLLVLNHYAVHTRLMAKKEMIEKYKAKPNNSPQKNPVYAAMVESVDQSFGRIYRTLESNNLLKNTVIIFISDNGGASCTTQAPIRGMKGQPFEGGIRIPQLIYWPGVTRPGTETDIPVSNIDFLPTMADALGLTPAGPVDGVSILPILNGEGKLKRDTLFWHFPHYHNSPPNSVVRKGDFKLIRFYASGKDYLYNLKNDPYEKVDLANKQPEVAIALGKLLDKHIKDLDGQLPRKADLE